MKRVTAYVNTTRVHWLVEELQAAGVNDMRVIEHFSPMSQISRLQLLCEDELVGNVRDIIRRLGTTGSRPDFDVAVSDFDPDLPSQIPMGQRMSVLEEPLLARRIRSIFKGASTRLSIVFSVLALSVVAVGVFAHVQLWEVTKNARESSSAVRSVSNAARSIQTAHLEELLAGERFHRGNAADAVRDIQTVRGRLEAGVRSLQQSQLVDRKEIDELIGLEKRFQTLIDSMFLIATRLREPAAQLQSERQRLSESHAEIMISLDRMHLQCMEQLASLESTVNELVFVSDNQNNKALNAVRFSIIGLAIAATIITILMWFVTRRKVSRPLDILLEEATALDDGELK